MRIRDRFGVADLRENGLGGRDAAAVGDRQFQIRRQGLRAWGKATSVVHPEGKMRKGIETVRPLIVVQEAAAIPPSATFVLGWLGRLPCPGPVQRHRRRALG